MNVLIVGGGIVGASCAAVLAERGAGVVVMDAGKPRWGTSMANAGHVVVSHSVPMAAPGMVRQGLVSLLTRDGAFALASSPGRGTWAWLLRFARHCTEANVTRYQPGIDQLLRRSAELLRECSDLEFTRTGLWQVFTSSTSRASAEAAHLRHHSVQVREVAIDEIRAEPGLTSKVVAAIELTEDFGLDPAALWQLMRRRSEAAGARWEQAVVADTRDVNADIVVLAAGAWSPATVRSQGIDLPIRAAKGYSVTLSGITPESMPTRPLLLMDQRTAVNALPGGSTPRLRLSSRYEITRADDREIVHHRIGALIERARVALEMPVDPVDVEPWTGVRPASVDGAPYVGFLPRTNGPRVLVATGHGMIGTAMAAGTADLVGRLAFEEPVSQVESMLSPTRLLV